jgi:hypothetical protein
MTQPAAKEHILLINLQLDLHYHRVIKVVQKNTIWIVVVGFKKGTLTKLV